jgi:D-3-phosphoglycerate dehydrogenase
MSDPSEPLTILLTTTSYQDCPGEHHHLLEGTGAHILRERGPLSEARMLELVGEVDALLCGDDAVTKAVIDKALPRLKVIAKYGIGVDKIDVDYATACGIPVSFCPGVNHTTVAEHVFALLLALTKNLLPQATACASGKWQRCTGTEIMGKTIGIVGLGRIGREVALRAKAFGMPVVGYDLYWPDSFAQQQQIERADTLEVLLATSDIVTLHTNLTEQTRNLINEKTLAVMKRGALLINCGRGELAHAGDIARALGTGQLGGYGADVLDQEPPPKDHPLLGAENCVITPHIGSRTFESVQRQALMATQNLIHLLKGEAPLAQVNKVPPPKACL